MSNTRKIRWSEAEVTAATAEGLLGELWAEGEAYAAQQVVTDRLAADMVTWGCTGEQIAQMRAQAGDLGADYWADLYRRITESSA